MSITLRNLTGLVTLIRAVIGHSSAQERRWLAWDRCARAIKIGKEEHEAKTGNGLNLYAISQRPF
jgi:hypothetical protein